MQVVILSLEQLLDVSDARAIQHAMAYVQRERLCLAENIPALQQEIIAAVSALREPFNTGKYVTWEAYFEALLEKAPMLQNINADDANFSNVMKTAFNSMVKVPQDIDTKLNELIDELGDVKLCIYLDINAVQLASLQEQGLDIHADRKFYGMPLYLSYTFEKLHEALIEEMIMDIKTLNPDAKILLLLADEKEMTKPLLKLIETQENQQICVNHADISISVRPKDMPLITAIQNGLCTGLIHNEEDQSRPSFANN